MPESLNPLLPAWYDVVWSATMAVIFVLLVVSLISIARTDKSLSSFQSLVWTLVAILVPIVGPLAWLFIGRRSLVASRDARKARATS